MLKELIEQGYGSDIQLNCAEKILYGANEVYNLGLDSEALKLASGFGGGMAVESTCGAVTGSVMVLGKLFKQQSEEEKEEFRELIKEFLENFEKDLGDIDCAPLKEEYRTEKDKCREIIIRTAQILENTVEREMNKRNTAE